MSQALLEAISQDDVAAVKTQVATVDWSVRDGFGRAPLGMAAARAGTKARDILTVLLDAGADVNAAQGAGSDEEEGWTALHQACVRGTSPEALGAVEVLLARGAKADGVSAKASVTPLELALRTHHLGIAEALLKAGANPDAVGPSGMAPLHLLVQLYREREGDRYKKGEREHMAGAAVKLLLAHGAKPGTKDKKGETALAKALLHRLPEEFVLALVAAGAPLDEWVDLGTPPEQVLVTPASMAVGLGQPPSVIKAMLETGLDTTKPVAPDQQNLLHYAAMKRFAALALVLEHRPTQDVDARDASGATPLFLASWMGLVSSVQALLARKANPDIPDLDGNTPLHTAARNGLQDVVEVLLAAGANKSLRNLEGETAADRARQKGHATLAALLG
nr:ankyrin repeat domain-containing protein [Myxococcus sp. MH1]